jgi:hypothetical protein
MDDDQIDVKVPAGEEASIETPSVPEPKATEEVETTPEESEIKTDNEGETKTETEKAPKKGAEARIRELNAKAKSAEEKAKSLEEQLAELTSPAGQVPQVQQYQPQVQPGQELTTEQYKQDVLQTAQGVVDLQIKQNNALNRINSEAGEVIRKYPQLDPESDSFNKELSDSVTAATMAHVRAEPYTASPKKFVEQMMKPYLRAVTREIGKETENIAKQVSETAVRPTSAQPTEKSFKELSIKEMEKKLGIVTP